MINPGNTWARSLVSSLGDLQSHPPMRRLCNLAHLQLHCMCYLVSSCKKKRKEKFMLFSDHNGSLLRRQPRVL